MEAIALQPADTRQSGSVALHSPTTFRVFSLQEERMLTTEARGFLTRVRTMGLLADSSTEEEIIDRALRSAEEPVSEQEIKLITILTLLSRSNSLWLREIDCFLENDWARIYH